MTKKELQLRGAWLLLMNARAYVLHNKDFAADEVLANSINEIKSSNTNSVNGIIESRFWFNPNGRPYVGVDYINFKTGESSPHKRY
jgi:hypothetical protein